LCVVTTETNKKKDDESHGKCREDEGYPVEDDRKRSLVIRRRKYRPSERKTLIEKWKQWRCNLKFRQGRKTFHVSEFGTMAPQKSNGQT